MKKSEFMYKSMQTFKPEIILRRIHHKLNYQTSSKEQARKEKLVQLHKEVVSQTNPVPWEALQDVAGEEVMGVMLPALAGYLILPFTPQSPVSWEEMFQASGPYPTVHKDNLGSF